VQVQVYVWMKIQVWVRDTDADARSDDASCLGRVARVSLRIDSHVFFNSGCMYVRALLL
jgi:hypothetical protein